MAVAKTDRLKEGVNPVNVPQNHVVVIPVGRPTHAMVLVILGEERVRPADLLVLEVAAEKEIVQEEVLEIEDLGVIEGEDPETEVVIGIEGTERGTLIIRGEDEYVRITCVDLITCLHEHVKTNSIQFVG